MPLPLYKFVKISDFFSDSLNSFLASNPNLTQPIVFNILILKAEDQIKFIKLAEQFYQKNHRSFRFPYAIYILTSLTKETSHLSLVHSVDELPQFFKRNIGNDNSHEIETMRENKFIQREIEFSDYQKAEEKLQHLSVCHKKIYYIDEEIKTYRWIIHKIRSKKDDYERK